MFFCSNIYTRKNQLPRVPSHGLKWVQQTTKVKRSNTRCIINACKWKIQETKRHCIGPPHPHLNESSKKEYFIAESTVIITISVEHKMEGNKEDLPSEYESTPKYCWISRFVILWWRGMFWNRKRASKEREQPYHHIPFSKRIRQLNLYLFYVEFYLISTSYEYNATVVTRSFQWAWPRLWANLMASNS